MTKKLKINPKLCTGCDSCGLTCSFAHENYFSFSKSRISIQKNGEKAESIPRVCVQCKGKPCIEACPTDALSKSNHLNTIIWDGRRCTHCHLCAEACPFGGIQFDPETDELLVCDLCDGDPECVKVCQFPQAIRFEEG